MLTSCVEAVNTATGNIDELELNTSQEAYQAYTAMGHRSCCVAYCLLSNCPVMKTTASCLQDTGTCYLTHNHTLKRI